MSRVGSVVAALSILETASFVALLTAMAAGSETGVSMTGMVHGLLFAAYAVVIWTWRESLRWSTGFVVLAVLTGPVGAIIALERLRRDRSRPPRGAMDAPRPATEPPNADDRSSALSRK